MVADPTGSQPIKAHLQRLRAALARGSAGSVCDSAAEAEGLESLGGPDELGPLSGPQVRDRVEQARSELDRIVRDYLGGDRALHDLADEIVRTGGRALRFLAAGDDDEFVRHPEALGGLEAIVRVDGSRPSFLIRDDHVDKLSSPLGSWEPALDGDADLLRQAVRCVGRVDDPASAHGFQGTGFLVHPDLLLTNRHVLQAVGSEGADHRWTLRPGVAVDFGHEFRGRESVRRRRLRGVVFAGATPIRDGPVDHANLDLALVELEPADGEAPPATGLSIEASSDWAGPGGPDVYVIGYPAKPPGGSYVPSLLEQLFQQTFGYKRLAPGATLKPAHSPRAWTAAHDVTTLGGNSGSVVVAAGRPVIAAGLHYGGTVRREPPENWCHVLGLTLDRADATGQVLGEVLERKGVRLNNRALSGF